jgi:hypothetical protein
VASALVMEVEMELDSSSGALGWMGCSTVLDSALGWVSILLGLVAR